MKKECFRLKFKNCSLPAVFTNFVYKWRKKVAGFLVVALLLLVFSSSASAAVSAFVARCDEGSYHQYCYDELIDSYVKSFMGRPNGLYDDFRAKSIVALHTFEQGYIDYEALLEQQALTLKNSGAFSLERYLRNGEAVAAKMPDQLVIVSVVSGSLNREEKILKNEDNKANREHNDNPAKDPGKKDDKPDEEDVKETPSRVPPGGSPDPKPAPPPEPRRESKPDQQAFITHITGSAKITEAAAIKWAEKHNAHQRFIDVVSFYWQYGEKSGIRPEVLYAQAALESGFGHFRGQVTPAHNNWAGIKIATSNGDRPEDHERFKNPEDGARGHFNHISAYVGLPPIGETHGRYDVITRMPWAGTVEKIADLSGKWAPSLTYHHRIVEMLEEMNE